MLDPIHSPPHPILQARLTPGISSKKSGESITRVGGRTMKKSRLNEEQIIGILREQEAGAMTADVRRKRGISSFYKWKAKYRSDRLAREQQCCGPERTRILLRLERY